MLVSPILASLIAFGAAVFVLEMTRRVRASSSAVNFLIVAVAVFLSIFLAAEASRSPQASGGHMFYLWIAYIVFSLFRRKKKPANDKDAKVVSNDTAI